MGVCIPLYSLTLNVESEEEESEPEPEPEPPKKAIKSKNVVAKTSQKSAEQEIKEQSSELDAKQSKYTDKINENNKENEKQSQENKVLNDVKAAEEDIPTENNTTVKDGSGEKEIVIPESEDMKVSVKEDDDMLNVENGTKKSESESPENAASEVQDNADQISREESLNNSSVSESDVHAMHDISSSGKRSLGLTFFSLLFLG